MSDPERLLDHGSDLEARLLSSALDEPPPADLLARTLQTVVPAGPHPPADALPRSGAEAVAKGGAAAAKAAGGGLLGAIGVGALAGLLAVTAFGLSSRRSPPPAALSASSSEVPSAITPPAVPTPVEPQPIEASPAPSAPAPAPSGLHPSTLVAELALLDEARTALRGRDPARARAVLDRYRRENPHGQLAREASMLRAEAAAATIDAGPTNP